MRAQEEHRLLGLALTWLSRFLVIGASYLQGGLQSPAQPYPVAMVVARARDTAGTAHLWSALGTAPRPAFSLTVTIAVEPHDLVERFPVVQAVELRGTSVDGPLLAGRVTDEDLTPVAGASLSLRTEDGAAVAERGSDDGGAFAFPDVAFATYRLLARAPGHADSEKPVVYARNSQVHDVVLTRT
jgi:hypothetical protein